MYACISYLITLEKIHNSYWLFRNNWVFCLCGWTMTMDSSKNKPVIRSKVKQEKYTSVVFVKNPPMIKLKRNSIEAYCKRIQLRSSFWGENCVYLLVLFFSGFIAILSLVSNRSLHSFSFVMVNMLQANALICVTPSFLLLRPLLFSINARHKHIMYLGFVHNEWQYRWNLDSSTAPLFLSLSLWQDKNIGIFVSLFSVFLHLLWRGVSSVHMTCVVLRFPRHAEEPPLGFLAHVFSWSFISVFPLSF